MNTKSKIQYHTPLLHITECQVELGFANTIEKIEPDPEIDW